MHGFTYWRRYPITEERYGIYLNRSRQAARNFIHIEHVGSSTPQVHADWIDTRCSVFEDTENDGSLYVGMESSVRCGLLVSEE